MILTSALENIDLTWSSGIVPFCVVDGGQRLLIALSE